MTHSLHEARQDFVRRHVTRVLKAHDWSRTRAALALEIERSYLHKLIRELRIPCKPKPRGITDKKGSS